MPLSPSGNGDRVQKKGSEIWQVHTSFVMTGHCRIAPGVYLLDISCFPIQESPSTKSDICLMNTRQGGEMKVRGRAQFHGGILISMHIIIRPCNMKTGVAEVECVKITYANNLKRRVLLG